MLECAEERGPERLALLPLQEAPISLFMRCGGAIVRHRKIKPLQRIEKFLQPQAGASVSRKLRRLVQKRGINQGGELNRRGESLSLDSEKNEKGIGAPRLVAARHQRPN